MISPIPYRLCELHRQDMHAAAERDRLFAQARATAPSRRVTSQRTTATRRFATGSTYARSTLTALAAILGLSLN